jgi:hypothetical protein
VNKNILIALSITLALAACAQKAEEATAEAAIEAAAGGKADVDINGGNTQITMQTEQGAAVMNSGENLALPADFPSDVVLADERKVVSVFAAAGATVLSYTTSGKLADLVAGQDAAMKAKGWTQTMSMNSDAATSMLVFNKDGRDAALAYNADASGMVTVTVQLSPKK